MEVTTMAWIYPDLPCDAQTEYTTKDITILKPQYYTLQDAGTLVQDTVSSAGCLGYSPENVASIKAASEKQFVTISGQTNGMVALTTSPTLTQTFITTMLTFLQSSGFTGVELDFEGFSKWNEQQYGGYLTFLTQLGNALHAQGFQLMIDGPVIFNAKYQGYYPFKYEDLEKLPADFLVAMCYDLQSDNGAGTPIAPLSTLTACCQWMKSKITDTSRIVIGIPSYAYQGATGTYHVKKFPSGQASNLPGFETATRDPASGEMMWSQNGISYSYADSTTMDMRLQTVLAQGISHISVWSLGENPWFSSVHPQPVPPTPQPPTTRPLSTIVADMGTLYAELAQQLKATGQ
jgi:spore germination protein YaaH